MFLDSIPIVGHVKGGLHFLVGDIKGGNKAIFEATRSTAVMVGGALGAVGGPVGMAAGAVGAGMVADLFSSAISGSPEGVLGGVIGIATGIANGEVPIESALELTLCIAGDVVGGIGGATIANEATKEIGKEIGKDVGKQVAEIMTKTTITHTIARTFKPQTKNTYRNKSYTTSESKKKIKKDSGNSTEAGGAGEPPEDKQNKIKKYHYEETDTHWEALFRLFGVMCLDDICMGRYSTHIFKNLDDGQKKSLYKLISLLRRQGGTYFVNVIKIVDKIFYRTAEKDVTFQNFISLVQFVMQYVGEEVAKRNDKLSFLALGSGAKLKPFKERQKELADIITIEIEDNVTDIYNTFYELQFNVCLHLHRISPSFRNDVSAVYHYFKHRYAPEKINALSIEEYFDLIASSLQTLKTLPHFDEFFFSRREMVYEKFLKTFGRRLRTVVKVQGGHLELSSCYFLTVHIIGDKDGDEYVDGKKIYRWILFLKLHRYKVCMLVLIICMLCIFFIYF